MVVLPALSKPNNKILTSLSGPDFNFLNIDNNPCVWVYRRLIVLLVWWLDEAMWKIKRKIFAIFFIISCVNKNGKRSDFHFSNLKLEQNFP